MRKLLLCLICMALFSLGALPIKAGLLDEISGWFGDDKEVPPRQQAIDAPPPAPAPGPPMVARPVPRKSTPASRGVKVAILLPLSGEQEALGKSLLHGAELAVMELASENFELMPRDAGSTPAEAVSAARDVLGEGARLIIGPLFSASVDAVKPLAASAGVPVLALSNDWKAAGGGAYLVGFSPVEQVQKIAAFAAAQNLNEIAVMAPSSAYGEMVLAALNLPGSPLTVITVVRYQNNAASIAAAVQEIVMKRDSFRALFLPEGGQTLRRIASQLGAKNITAQEVPFLGTGLWDDENLGNVPALVGGWYAAPESSAYAAFVDRYQKNFGAKPARLASLAYDAIALAVALASRGGPDLFSDAALTNPNGFAGLDGIFRLTPSGLAEHGLAVKEVTKGGATILEAAPTRF